MLTRARPRFKGNRQGAHVSWWRIVARDRHEVLPRRDGFYANLYRQFIQAADAG